jgi:hypothetical protein
MHGSRCCNANRSECQTDVKLTHKQCITALHDTQHVNHVTQPRDYRHKNCRQDRYIQPVQCINFESLPSPVLHLRPYHTNTSCDTPGITVVAAWCTFQLFLPCAIYAASIFAVCYAVTVVQLLDKLEAWLHHAALLQAAKCRHQKCEHCSRPISRKQSCYQRHNTYSVRTHSLKPAVSS